MSMQKETVHVLVVDDNDLVLDLLQDILSNEGYQVSAADGAPSAMRQLHKLPKLDVLVSDFNLGGPVDGIDLATTIRQQFPRLQTVFISGRSDLILKKLEAGDASEYLRKPFAAQELTQAVDRAASRRA